MRGLEGLKSLDFVILNIYEDPEFLRGQVVTCIAYGQGIPRPRQLTQ